MCFPSHSPISQHVLVPVGSTGEAGGANHQNHNLFRFLQRSCLFCNLISFATSLAHRTSIPLMAPPAGLLLPGSGAALLLKDRESHLYVSGVGEFLAANMPPSLQMAA